MDPKCLYLLQALLPEKDLLIFSRIFQNVGNLVQVLDLKQIQVIDRLLTEK